MYSHQENDILRQEKPNSDERVYVSQLYLVDCNKPDMTVHVSD